MASLVLWRSSAPGRREGANCVIFDMISVLGGLFAVLDTEYRSSECSIHHADTAVFGVQYLSICSIWAVLSIEYSIPRYRHAAQCAVFPTLWPTLVITIPEPVTLTCTGFFQICSSLWRFPTWIRVEVRARVWVRDRGLLPTTSHSIFYSRVGQMAIFSNCQPSDWELLFEISESYQPTDCRHRAR